MLLHYRVCGLACASEIELPSDALGESPAAPEVTVRYGVVPEELEAPTHRDPEFQVAGDTMLLRLARIGRFLVRAGREIVVDPAPEVSSAQLRLSLAGPGFGALLHQRGVLPLHASAVQVGDGCVGFLGESGAGKSTLGAALHRRGYPLVADDVLPVAAPRGGDATVHPGFPRLKLRADSLALLDVAEETLTASAGSAGGKYELPALAHAAAPLPLRRLYLLSEAAAGDAEAIGAVEGPERLRALLDNTYLFGLLRGLDRTPRHFLACVELLRTVPIRRLHRESGLSQLARLLDELEEDLASLRAPEREAHELRA